MIWAAFSSSFKTQIVFIGKTINSNKYVDILRAFLLPNWNQEWYFQQDNASIHTSATSKSFFSENKINVIR